MPSATPIFTKRDPATGAVLFDFSGHIHADGLDLDATQSGGTPADDNSIRWIRPSDSVVSSKVGTFSIPGTERLTIDVGRNTGIRPGIDFNLGRTPNDRTLSLNLGVDQPIGQLGSAGNLQGIMPRTYTIAAGTALSNGCVVYSDLEVWVDPFGYFNLVGEIRAPLGGLAAGATIATGATLGTASYPPRLRCYWYVTGNSGQIRIVGITANGTMIVGDFGGPGFSSSEVFNLGAMKYRHNFSP